MNSTRPQLKRRGAIALAVCTVLAAALAVVARPLPETDVVVYVAANLRGVVDPGGCYPGQLGGLSRLCGYLRKALPAEKAAALYVQGGPSIEGNGPQSELKFELALRTFQRAGCRAYAVAGADLMLGIDAIRAAQKKVDIPFVATNLVDKDGVHFFKPFVVTTVGKAPGKQLRVCILSFMSKDRIDYADGFGGSGALEDPQERMTAILKDPGITADCYVIFFEGDIQQAYGLRQFLSTRNQTSIAIVRVASELPAGLRTRRTSGSIVEAGQEGRKVLRIAASHDKKEKTFEIVQCDTHELGPKVPADATVTGWLADYEKAVAAMNLVATLPRWPCLDASEGEHYAGAESCKGCHAPQYKIWSGLAHRRAFDALKKAGTAANPDCVACHATGFRLETGFVSEQKTPQLVGVTCEACHGPMARHTKDTNIRDSLRPRLICTRCHTPEHSGQFKQNEYMKKIKHWNLSKPGGPPAGHTKAAPDAPKETEP